MDTDPLDPVWKALANPARRMMLDLLRDDPLTTGDLTSAFPELSRYSVMQHLDVLEEANLIVVRRLGRQRYNYLNAVPIREIYERWVSRYEGHWASALIALRDSIEGTEGERDLPDVPRKKTTKKKTSTQARDRKSKGASKRPSTPPTRHRRDEKND